MIREDGSTTSNQHNPQESNNVTVRRGHSTRKSNMEYLTKPRLTFGREGSILIDNILSQDEAKDIVSMMIMADEYDIEKQTSSFCTSTQMGGRNQECRPTSPLLSPLGSQDRPDYDGRDVVSGGLCGELINLDKLSDRVRVSSNTVGVEGKNLKNSRAISESLEIGGIRDEVWSGDLTDLVGDQPSIIEECLDIKRPGGGVEDPGSVAKESILVTRNGTSHNVVNQDVAKVSERPAGDVNNGLVGVNEGEAELEGNGNQGPTPPNRNLGTVTPTSCPSSPSGSPSGSQGGSSSPTRPNVSADSIDVLDLLTKLEKVDEVARRADLRAGILGKTVQDLESSLEFSQQEIDTLKKENADLKKKMGEMETEDKRTQFQATTIEDKMDRLETLIKKKNLLIEGVPEPTDRREDIEKTMGGLFDELAVNKPISFEACYRLGPYNKNKPRPILVSFEKQADKDLIFAKRMELRGTTNFQKVWLSEDLGALSKRRRNLIRLISKEAQMQGVDCRTGKYSLHIDRKKFDHSNLEDLPPKLCPAQLKQVQIDARTVAYQSEFAPFSNFFPCKIVIGSLSFFCLEQAFLFLKAKILNHPLAATRIYLSRDVYYIKSTGNDLGTSPEWERRRFDIMYECLKRKFLQHPDLRALLLKTGDLELVEATPDRLWGCGATISSNVLRKHEWPGQNKHGEILMIVRDELRLLVNV